MNPTINCLSGAPCLMSRSFVAKTRVCSSTIKTPPLRALQIYPLPGQCLFSKGLLVLPTLTRYHSPPSSSESSGSRSFLTRTCIWPSETTRIMSVSYS